MEPRNILLWKNFTNIDRIVTKVGSNEAPGCTFDYEAVRSRCDDRDWWYSQRELGAMRRQVNILPMHSKTLCQRYDPDGVELLGIEDARQSKKRFIRRKLKIQYILLQQDVNRKVQMLQRKLLANQLIAYSRKVWGQEANAFVYHTYTSSYVERVLITPRLYERIESHCVQCYSREKIRQ